MNAGTRYKALIGGSALVLAGAIGGAVIGLVGSGNAAQPDETPATVVPTVTAPAVTVQPLAPTVTAESPAPVVSTEAPASSAPTVEPVTSTTAQVFTPAAPGPTPDIQGNLPTNTPEPQVQLSTTPPVSLD